MARQLFLGWGVEVLETCQHVLDWFYVVDAIPLMERLAACVQSDHRVDTAEPGAN